MFKNNKGFSLIEVLVTVGLIGVLVAIAIPSYNKYKDGTNLMAMKADLSNGMKTYTAYDAVNDTFCATFSDVGFNVNAASPVWKRNAFIGFGGVNSLDCNQTVGSTINYQSAEGADANQALFGNMNDCKAAGGTWDAASKCSGAKLQAFKYKGQVPAGCSLGANSFIIGATSESAGKIDSNGGGTIIQIKDTGEISESVDLNCH